MHRYKQTNHNEPYQGYTKGKNLAELDDNKKMEDEISETVGEILSKKTAKERLKKTEAFYCPRK